jgi:hypothetical protein
MFLGIYIIIRLTIMQIVQAAGLFRKYKIIKMKSVRVPRGEDGTGTRQTNALWVHDVPGKDFQFAETYHRMCRTGAGLMRR